MEKPLIYVFKIISITFLGFYKLKVENPYVFSIASNRRFLECEFHFKEMKQRDEYRLIY